MEYNLKDKYIIFNIEDFPHNVQNHLISTLDINGLLANEEKFRSILAASVPSLSSPEETELLQKIILGGQILPLKRDAESGQLGFNFKLNQYKITLATLPGKVEAKKKKKKIKPRFLAREELYTEAVKEFSGEYRDFSNFEPAVVTYEGVDYPTVEHAYQAAKTINPAEREAILKASTPGKAKRLGQKVNLRPDWESIKIDIMKDLVTQKFKKNPNLANLLLSTGDQPLEEGNNWGDKFWGISGGKGENHLGKILMEIREELRKPEIKKIAEEDVPQEESELMSLQQYVQNVADGSIPAIDVEMDFSLNKVAGNVRRYVDAIWVGIGKGPIAIDIDIDPSRIEATVVCPWCTQDVAEIKIDTPESYITGQVLMTQHMKVCSNKDVDANDPDKFKVLIKKAKMPSLKEIQQIVKDETWQKLREDLSWTKDNISDSLSRLRKYLGENPSRNKRVRVLNLLNGVARGGIMNDQIKRMQKSLRKQLGVEAAFMPSFTGVHWDIRPEQPGAPLENLYPECPWDADRTYTKPEDIKDPTRLLEILKKLKLKPKDEKKHPIASLEIEAVDGDMEVHKAKNAISRAAQTGNPKQWDEAETAILGLYNVVPIKEFARIAWLLLCEYEQLSEFDRALAWLDKNKPVLEKVYGKKYERIFETGPTDDPGLREKITPYSSRAKKPTSVAEAKLLIEKGSYEGKLLGVNYLGSFAKSGQSNAQELLRDYYKSIGNYIRPDETLSSRVKDLRKTIITAVESVGYPSNAESLYSIYQSTPRGVEGEKGISPGVEDKMEIMKYISEHTSKEDEPPKILTGWIDEKDKSKGGYGLNDNDDVVRNAAYEDYIKNFIILGYGRGTEEGGTGSLGMIPEEFFEKLREEKNPNIRMNIYRQITRLIPPARKEFWDKVRAARGKGPDKSHLQMLEMIDEDFANSQKKGENIGPSDIKLSEETNILNSAVGYKLGEPEKIGPIPSSIDALFGYAISMRGLPISKKVEILDGFIDTFGVDSIKADELDNYLNDQIKDIDDLLSPLGPGLTDKKKKEYEDRRASDKLGLSFVRMVKEYLKHDRWIGMFETLERKRLPSGMDQPSLSPEFEGYSKIEAAKKWFEAWSKWMSDEGPDPGDPPVSTEELEALAGEQLFKQARQPPTTWPSESGTAWGLAPALPAHIPNDDELLLKDVRQFVGRPIGKWRERLNDLWKVIIRKPLSDKEEGEKEKLVQIKPLSSLDVKAVADLKTAYDMMDGNVHEQLDAVNWYFENVEKVKQEGNEAKDQLNKVEEEIKTTKDESKLAELQDKAVQIRKILSAAENFSQKIGERIDLNVIQQALESAVHSDNLEVINAIYENVGRFFPEKYQKPTNVPFPQIKELGKVFDPRLAVVKAYADLGNVEGLTKALSNPNITVQAEAIKYLAELGQSDLLYKKYQETSVPEIKGVITHFLGKSKDVDFLVKVLHSKDVDAQKAAIQWLAYYGQHDTLNNFLKGDIASELRSLIEVELARRKVPTKGYEHLDPAEKKKNIDSLITLAAKAFDPYGRSLLYRAYVDESSAHDKWGVELIWNKVAQDLNFKNNQEWWRINGNIFTSRFVQEFNKEFPSFSEGKEALDKLSQLKELGPETYSNIYSPRQLDFVILELEFLKKSFDKEFHDLIKDIPGSKIKKDEVAKDIFVKLEAPSELRELDALKDIEVPDRHIAWQRHLSDIAVFLKSKITSLKAMTISGRDISGMKERLLKHLERLESAPNRDPAEIKRVEKDLENLEENEAFLFMASSGALFGLEKEIDKFNNKLLDAPEVAKHPDSSEHINEAKKLLNELISVIERRKEEFDSDYEAFVEHLGYKDAFEELRLNKEKTEHTLEKTPKWIFKLEDLKKHGPAGYYKNDEEIKELKSHLRALENDIKELNAELYTKLASDEAKRKWHTREQLQKSINEIKGVSTIKTPEEYEKEKEKEIKLKYERREPLPWELRGPEKLGKTAATYDSWETDQLMTHELSEREDYGVQVFPHHDYIEDTQNFPKVPEKARHQQEEWNRSREKLQQVIEDWKRKRLHKDKRKVGLEEWPKDNVVGGEGDNGSPLPYAGGKQSPTFFNAMPAQKYSQMAQDISITFEFIGNDLKIQCTWEKGDLPPDIQEEQALARILSFVETNIPKALEQFKTVKLEEVDLGNRTISLKISG